MEINIETPTEQTANAGDHPANSAASKRAVDHPWWKSYPPTVPREIDATEHDSLVAMCEQACQAFGGRKAIGNFGSFLSFTELDRLSLAFAAYLQRECAIVSGDRIALMMPNMLAYPVALLGALRAGAIVVNTNPQYTARELAHQLANSGARVIVIFEAALATLREVRAETALEHVIVSRLGDFMSWPRNWIFDLAVRRRAKPIRIDNTIVFKSAIEQGRHLPFTAPRLTHADLAFLQYTGGTTGRSKGAMLSHGNIISNILQVVAWFGAREETNREVVITPLPLYHIYALTANCFASLVQGSLNYLITDPRDLRTFIRELKRVRFTALTGVNTLFNALLNHPDFASVDFSSLKYTNGGGMAIQRTVAERWQQTTGQTLAEGYGLTEASPVVAVNRSDASEFTGCIGLPVPSTECRVIDDAGQVLSTNEPGELCVRGPQVMQGYWNAPEETSATLDADGWLHTGDIAIIQDDGFIRLVDRKKDMILVSGFNVYPNELEAVATLHPLVIEAAAIAVSDDKSGEVPRLVVVRASNSLDAEQLLAHCRAQLTAYKVPRSVIFVDELPKSNVGKILRRVVRERHGH